MNEKNQDAEMSDGREAGSVGEPQSQIEMEAHHH